MKKNVCISVHIAFPLKIPKSDVANILRNLDYEVIEEVTRSNERYSNFTKDIQLNIESIEDYLKKSELEIKSTLAKCNVQITQFLFFAEYEN